MSVADEDVTRLERGWRSWLVGIGDDREIIELALGNE
jgi:hypothetical protein